MDKVTQNSTTFLKNEFRKTTRKVIRAFLFQLFLSFSWMIIPVAAQQYDSISTAESKAETLKYLRSLAALEQAKCDGNKFISTYDVDLTSGSEVKVLVESWMKTTPESEAKNCTTVLAAGTIVKVYNYSHMNDYLAVKHNNQWGFIHKSSVKGFE